MTDNPVEDLAEIRRALEALLTFARLVARMGDEIDDKDEAEAALAFWMLVRTARELVKRNA